MLWLKAFHIILMVTWFAGLFYLPRLFVYHAQAVDRIGQDRFKTMERKLLIIMSIGAVGTVITGLWLLGGWWAAALSTAGWLHVKLTCVLALIAYHLWMWRTVRVFAADSNRRSDRFYRMINEIPALLLVAIVIMVVVKPF
ncbi:protoporphyrinogen oxidase HemJ [Abyssibacter sp.]|uniref:protoporphyrinogen oxidase HemJ n=1 Tax=Abyssibacter sp. TaxID=2320200 RepID=UPI0025C623CD|nr:protoporphyrinogen oxidase HemJ [Abyssibacter sp.]MCK5858496.1 protoporphyrinogen oxidase HemJ [Abyssibacter sp.]